MAIALSEVARVCPNVDRRMRILARARAERASMGHPLDVPRSTTFIASPSGEVVPA